MIITYADVGARPLLDDQAGEDQLGTGQLKGCYSTYWFLNNVGYIWMVIYLVQGKVYSGSVWAQPICTLIHWIAAASSREAAYFVNFLPLYLTLSSSLTSFSKNCKLGRDVLLLLL